MFKLLSSAQAAEAKVAKREYDAKALAELKLPGLEPFVRKMPKAALYSRPELSTLQLNITRKCNLECKHCHVESGPHRCEEMSPATQAKALQFYRENSFKLIDITGGAPEMNSNFRPFLRDCAAAAKAKDGGSVLVRSNLCILLHPAYADIIDLYAELGVEIVCSLPYYEREKTDRQRGEGVYETSIEVLQKLNAVGYGKTLPLQLVYNPGGAFLPGSQENLKAVYKKKLWEDYGIVFNDLYTITNAPIGRYARWLAETDNLESYMQRLAAAFNPEVAESVMCRDLVSVDWDGSLHDCDFNLALGQPILGVKTHLDDWIGRQRFGRRPIRYGNHCYGCTAGAGSS